MRLIKKIRIDKGDHFVTVNPDTNTIYVSNRKGNVIMIIDGLTNQIVDKIKINLPHQIIINEKSGLLFVETGTPKLILVDPKEKRIICSIPGSGTDLDIDSQTNEVYCCQRISNAIFVLDGTNLEIKKKIEVKKNPVAISFDPLTKFLFVANNDSDSCSVINVKEKTKFLNIKIPYSSKIIVNPNSRLLYCLQQEYNPGEVSDYFLSTLYSYDLKSLKKIGEFPKRDSLGKFWGTKKGHANFTINNLKNLVYYVYADKLFKLDQNLIKRTDLNLPRGSYQSIAINPVTDRIYLTRSGLLKNWLYVIEDI